jgi:hypothetical protein
MAKNPTMRATRRATTISNKALLEAAAAQNAALEGEIAQLKRAREHADIEKAKSMLLAIEAQERILRLQRSLLPAPLNNPSFCQYQG